MRSITLRLVAVPLLIPLLVACPADELVPGFTTLDPPRADPNIVGQVCSGGSWVANGTVTPAREEYPSLASLVSRQSSTDSAKVEAGFTKYVAGKLGASGSHVKSATLQGLSVLKAAAATGVLQPGAKVVTEAIAAKSIVLRRDDELDTNAQAGLSQQLARATGVSGQLTWDSQSKTATYATGTDLVIALRAAKVGNTYTTKAQPQIAMHGLEGSSGRYTVHIDKIDPAQWASNGLGAESEACVLVWVQDDQILEQGNPLRHPLVYCPTASRIQGTVQPSNRYYPTSAFQEALGRPIFKNYGASFETVTVDLSDLKLTYDGPHSIQVNPTTTLNVLAPVSAEGTVKLRVEGFPLTEVEAKCP